MQPTPDLATDTDTRALSKKKLCAAWQCSFRVQQGRRQISRAEISGPKPKTSVRPETITPYTSRGIENGSLFCACIRTDAWRSNLHDELSCGADGTGRAISSRRDGRTRSANGLLPPQTSPMCRPFWLQVALSPLHAQIRLLTHFECCVRGWSGWQAALPDAPGLGGERGISVGDGAGDVGAEQDQCGGVRRGRHRHRGRLVVIEARCCAHRFT